MLSQERLHRARRLYSRTYEDTVTSLSRVVRYMLKDGVNWGMLEMTPETHSPFRVCLLQIPALPHFFRVSVTSPHPLPPRPPFSLALAIIWQWLQSTERVHRDRCECARRYSIWALPTSTVSWGCRAFLKLRYAPVSSSMTQAPPRVAPATCLTRTPG